MSRVGWRYLSGAPLIGFLFAISFIISVYHLLEHQAPLVPTLLGQWSLLAATFVFGTAGLYCLTRAKTVRERSDIGLHVAGLFGGGGLASGLYGFHQYLSPVVKLPIEGVLFGACFVALIAGTIGAFMGLEVARRNRALADLQEERDRFSKLFQNIPEPAVEYRFEDDEMWIERANETFTEQFGIQPPIRIAEFNRVVAGLEEEEAEAAELDTLAKEGQQVEREVLRKTVEGRRWFKLRTSPHRQNGGFAIYLDITAQHVRGEQVQVLSRVLRHNIRNSLSVTQGYASQIQRETEQAEIETYAEKIYSASQDIVEITDRMEIFREALEEDPPKPERTEIVSILDQALVQTRGSFPRVEFTLESPESLWAKAHSSLGIAVEALVETLVEQNEQENPHVEISLRSVSEEGNGQAIIRITDNGSGFPDQELIPLKTETKPSQLKHAVTVDLWMANWFVNQFGGVLRGWNVETNSTVLEIRLDLVQPEEPHERSE